MAWSKEEKARRWAAAAGPYPRPRGRAPKAKTWVKEIGVWVARDSSSPPEAVATAAPVDDAGCEVVVTWEVPVVIPAAMDHVYEHTTPADILLPWYGKTATRLLHEHARHGSEARVTYFSDTGSPPG